MNNTILWIVIALLVIGGIAYYVTMDTASQPTVSEPTSTEIVADENQVTPQSLKDLVSAGKSQKCGFADENSDGLFFVVNGKARGDFNSRSGDETVDGHMIIDGSTSYIWMEGQVQGFKMMLNDSAQTTPTNANQSVDVNKKMEYHCEDWTPDSSVFTLPSGVTFLDLSAMAQ